MRHIVAILTLGYAALAQAPASDHQPIQDLNQIVGKQVIIQRTPLCKPGTYTRVLDYAGKTATVVSVKFTASTTPQAVLDKMPPAMRAMLEEVRKAGTILFGFEDGTSLDSCEPILPSSAPDVLELAPGQKLEPPPQTAAVVSTAAVTQGLQADHLSDAEILAAVASKPESGFVFIEDMGFTTPTFCKAQMPSEAIFTPAGWINAQARNVKKQYLSFHPDDEDTMRVLTVVSKGCASGTASGPVCDTISRVALLSDKAGAVVAEAINTKPLTQSWQNGYGASAACSALISRFSMADVQKVRGGKGEFLIATFNGSQLLKIYTVKEKHLKKLGL